MGFRSTFVTEDLGVRWPEWFVDKYNKAVHFPDRNVGCISSAFERKFYSNDMFEDIQKAVFEDNDVTSSFINQFVVILLHECGGITRVEITKDGIRFSEPDSYVKEHQVTHSYCYGCSDWERACGT